MTESHLKSPLLATALAALALVACSPSQDSRTAGQKVDDVIAQADQKAGEMKSDAKDAMSSAGDKMAGAADKVGNKVEDAAITVSVNAELAKDPALSALKINVDTVQGNVVLRGTAPDSQARARATQLASAVKGVVKVDNQLEVRG